MVARLVILWSDLIPRHLWHGAKSPVKIDKTRKKVNLGVVVCKLNGAVIRHSDPFHGSQKLLQNLSKSCYSCPLLQEPSRALDGD